jgi:FKBP-type peptidyl-prolyl cis-trans isomerase FkpA
VLRTTMSKRRARLAAAAAACMLILPFSVLAQSPAPTTSKMDAKVMQLQKNDVKAGTGAEAQAGKTVVVHYTGWLYDPAAPGQKGAKFDSSRDRQSPFSFPLGAGKVIRGWDEGVVGMKVGGQRILIIPSEMAYGSRGAGGVIPPDATLIFDVELIEVKG